MNRQIGLDSATFKRSNTVLTKALQGNKQLTRSELGQILQKAGVSVDGLRLGHLVSRAELDGLICSGARRGKQHTYALLDERAPHAKILEREEALAELTGRYFRSHGPATVQDFAWWSGLTMSDARQGIELIKSQLACETVDDQTYWLASIASKRKRAVAVHLLPNYDEYTVGYTDRDMIFDVAHTGKLNSRGSILFQYAIVIEGQVAGTWKRTIKNNDVLIELVLFSTLTEDQNQAIITAVQQYGKFLELPVVLR